MSEKKFPTWGYRRGEAKIFDLGEGEKLPPGWSDAPPPGTHPNVPKGAASEPKEEPPWETLPPEMLPPVSETPKTETPKTEKPKK